MKIKTASILQAHLEMAKHRSTEFRNTPVDAPLTPDEEQAFTIMRLRLQNAADPRPFNDCLARHGKKAMLQTYALPLRVMGVPHLWFVCNAVLALIVFTITQDLILMGLLALSVHIGIALMYKLKHKDIYQENIQNIIKGIK